MLGHEELDYCPFAKSEKFFSTRENGNCLYMYKKMQEKKARRNIFRASISNKMGLEMGALCGAFLGWGGGAKGS